MRSEHRRLLIQCVAVLLLAVLYYIAMENVWRVIHIKPPQFWLRGGLNGIERVLVQVVNGGLRGVVAAIPFALLLPLLIRRHAFLIAIPIALVTLAGPELLSRLPLLWHDDRWVGLSLLVEFLRNLCTLPLLTLLAESQMGSWRGRLLGYIEDRTQ